MRRTNFTSLKDVDERNRDLMKDYTGGMSLVEMITKYKISHARIYQIVNEMKAMSHAVIKN